VTATRHPPIRTPRARRTSGRPSGTTLDEYAVEAPRALTVPRRRRDRNSAPGHGLVVMLASTADGPARTWGGSTSFAESRPSASCAASLTAARLGDGRRWAPRPPDGAAPNNAPPCRLGLVRAAVPRDRRCSRCLGPPTWGGSRRAPQCAAVRTLAAVAGPARLSPAEVLPGDGNNVVQRILVTVR
jgi:hypothetical protein